MTARRPSPATPQLVPPQPSPSAPVLDIVQADDRWARVADAHSCVKAAVAAAHAPQAAGSVCVALENDATVRQLNKRWRGKDQPTNVLSFAGPDPAILAPGVLRHLGDIVLAYETVMAQAQAENIPPAHHLMHLVVHGMLHLHGMDHHTEAAAEAMEARERSILAQLGVADPYA